MFSQQYFPLSEKVRHSMGEEFCLLFLKCQAFLPSCTRQGCSRGWWMYRVLNSVDLEAVTQQQLGLSHFSLIKNLS